MFVALSVVELPTLHLAINDSLLARQLLHGSIVLGLQWLVEPGVSLDASHIDARVLPAMQVMAYETANEPGRNKRGAVRDKH